MFRLLIFLSFSFFISHTLAAEKSAPLKLHSGIWEGISENLTYNIFKISDTGQHQLYKTLIASAFRATKVFSFTDEDIRCSYSECIIEFDNTYEANSAYKLILTSNLDSFNVLEIAIDNKKKPILSTTYSIDRKKGKSTAREFIERYKERVISVVENPSSELYGLWVGTIIIREKVQLITLNINNKGQSEFVLFINGTNLTNETYFDFNGVDVTEGKPIKIETSHPTFANKLILHKRWNTSLVGHLYSYRKKNLLETADFTLYKIK